jgi:hypothetical protein
MEFLPPIATFALPATVLLLLTLLAVRLRQRGGGGRRRREDREAVDTIAGWPPEAGRVLTITERQAYDLLRRAVPGYLILAQVPLSRFIRVPTKRSYTEWLARVGSLSADLLVCDAGSRVLAVVDIRSPQETERSRRRHERLGRVLREAGVRVVTWREGELPSAIEVRHSFNAVLASVGAKRFAPSGPTPLIPVPEIAEILADGDRAAAEAHFEPGMEPVASAFLDELEAAGQAGR